MNLFIKKGVDRIKVIHFSLKLSDLDENTFPKWWAIFIQFELLLPKRSFGTKINQRKYLLMIVHHSECFALLVMGHLCQTDKRSKCVYCFTKLPWVSLAWVPPGGGELLSQDLHSYIWLMVEEPLPLSPQLFVKLEKALHETGRPQRDFLT